MDGDFANVLAYPPEQTAGIVVVKFSGRASRALILTLIRAFLDVLSWQQIGSRLWIVEPGRLRVHEPPGIPPTEQAE
jgi:hypothetical protein